MRPAMLPTGTSTPARPPNMTAAEIRAWRVSRALTQAAAASLLGVSVETWRSWELDRRHPDRWKVAAIVALGKK
jgi:DNA-binding transcriptional regulator YiaG